MSKTIPSNSYRIEATPFFKRVRLVQTTEIDTWFYDVVRNDGEPEGRFDTREEALAHLLKLRDA